MPNAHGIQGIHSFFGLVGHNGSHTIRTAVAIRTGCLRFASIRAAIRIPDERIFDIGAQDGSMSVPAAILGAKAGTFIDIR